MRHASHRSLVELLHPNGLDGSNIGYGVRVRQSEAGRNEKLLRRLPLEPMERGQIVRFPKADGQDHNMIWPYGLTRRRLLGRRP